MKQQDIQVAKTARYFLLGETNDPIEEVWFICHGHGHLAEYFIKHFEVLDNGKTLVVAPEALNRYYLKGVYGRVGAFWMTKEERLSDIHDYVRYLDAVHAEVLQKLDAGVRINVLGFSQGAATVCRWLANQQSRVDRMILWGGRFPVDFDYDNNRDYFNQFRVQIAIGDNDEYADAAYIQRERDLLDAQGLQHEFFLFDGTHAIQPELLKKLAENFR